MSDPAAQVFLYCFLILMALVGWNALLWLWRGLRRYLAIRKVASLLRHAAVSTRRRLNGYEVRVTGSLGGLPVRIAHQHLGDEYLICAVRLQNAVDGVSIYPTQGSSPVYLERQRRTGRMSSVGAANLDAKYAIQGTGGDEAAKLFRSGRLEATLDELFGPLGVMRVTTEEGWLVATRRLRRARVVDAEESLRIARRLVGIAALFSRQELSLELQGRSYAYTDETQGEGAICPYCRDSLDVSEGASGQLARCESCRTVHHEECYTEAGGCTVMGCAAQARSRRRAARL